MTLPRAASDLRDTGTATLLRHKRPRIPHEIPQDARNALTIRARRRGRYSPNVMDDSFQSDTSDGRSLTATTTASSIPGTCAALSVMTG